jgi:serine/threonine protein kinase
MTVFDKAPELLDGTTGVYSEKADVYALGMVSFAFIASLKLLKGVLRGLDNTGKIFYQYASVYN